MRVALVHDYLNQYGGAERVLETLHELYPDAPVYTSLYDPSTMPAHFRRWDIRTSFLQRIPASRRFHRSLLLLYPAAFESFDLSAYDVVVSVSSAWAKGIVTPPETLHICYCLTPMRWAWRYNEYVERERLGKVARSVLPAAMHYLRNWDVSTANRVDRFLGISQAVVARIAKYYRREAQLLAPPVEVRAIQERQKQDVSTSTSGDDPGFLVVSRLIPYKRIDLAVEACTRARLPLTVVGNGRDRERLLSLAGPTVRFAGALSDAAKVRLMSTCRAFIFPGEEDFGITPVEAMAAGCPVVAYAAGGALDTVLDGVTGRLFAPQTAEQLENTLLDFDPDRYDAARIRAHAATYATESFKTAFASYVEQAVAGHRAGQPVAGHELASI